MLEKDFPSKLSPSPTKEVGVIIVLSDKVDFKSKLVRRDKEGHCIVMKLMVHQKEIAEEDPRWQIAEQSRNPELHNFRKILLSQHS
jgi:hypothetical protein